MNQDRRSAPAQRDRRAYSRSGRRDGDGKKPWHMRRRLWLAVTSLAFVGWRRVRSIGRGADSANTNVAA